MWVIVSGKTPYIRFDLNDYSIPHQYTQSVVTVVASETVVRVVVGTQEIARHTRLYGRRGTAHAPEHLEALRTWKHHAGEGVYGNHYITQYLRSAQTLPQRLVERKYSLQRAREDLKRLLTLYGAEELEQVIQETLRSEAPSILMVTQLLEARRAHAGRQPALPLELPEHAAQHDTTPIKQHLLTQYDTLGTESLQPKKENYDTAE